MRIAEVCLAIFLINIIFGYWRANTRRFTLFWALAIHVPVVIAIILRVELLGWNWALVPIFVVAFFAGQFSGGWIRRKLAFAHKTRLGSFLFKDLIRIWSDRRKSDSCTDAPPP
jgi:hypothetical protein